MNLFSTMLGKLAAMGFTNIHLGRRGVSKHQNDKPYLYHVRNPGKKRLNISRGAGSISAKADIQQLVNHHRYAEARIMVLDHEQQCGEVLFPGAWWREINPLGV